MVKKIGKRNPIMDFILDNVDCSFELSLNQGNVIYVPVEVTVSADEDYLHITYHKDGQKCLIRLSSVNSIKTMENENFD